MLITSVKVANERSRLTLIFAIPYAGGRHYKNYTKYENYSMKSEKITFALNINTGKGS